MTSRVSQHDGPNQRREPSVRAAVESDAVAMADVHFAAVHETAKSCYPPAVLHAWSRLPDERRYSQMRQAILGSDELFVVAEDASGVVGFGSMAPGSREVTAVYVHPRAGRRGIGSQILAVLESLARDRNVTELHLIAPVYAELFYRRGGYEVVERSAHRLQSGLEMAAVTMAKRLE